MNVRIDEIQRTVQDLKESEFAYRVLSGGMYYFAYHTQTAHRGQKITVVLPLKSDKDLLFFDNHLTEAELLEKLKKK